jgi:hypothetical protein
MHAQCIGHKIEQLSAKVAAKVLQDLLFVLMDKSRFFMFQFALAKCPAISF